MAVAVPATGFGAAKGRGGTHGKAGKPGGKGMKKKGRGKGRPNIVVLMTDDQDSASIAYMPQLQSLIARRGVTFDNSIVNNSFCCPSRVTFLTGQYSKNHGVLNQLPPLGGYQKLGLNPGNLLPVWMKRAGYFTGHVGHYPEGYNLSTVPKGWDRWWGAADHGMYGFTLNVNGKLTKFGKSPRDITPRTYSTYVEARQAQTFLRNTRARKNRAKPFFLSIAPAAIHAEGEGDGPLSCLCHNNNPRAAPRDEGTMANVPFPKPPSYNEADVSDKPQITSSRALIPSFNEDDIAAGYRARLEALQSVDDMVGGLVRSLKRSGELRNTVFIYTSDNGWLQGEHRWGAGKVLPYEPSIKVPLLISGPGVPRNRVLPQLVANVDLAPTILDYARAKPGRKEDGRSLRQIFRRPATNWTRPILLEGYFNAGLEYGAQYPKIQFQGLRTNRYMYARWVTGEEELYDLATDPYELESRHNDPAYAQVKAGLQATLAALQRCHGRSCYRISTP